MRRRRDASADAALVRLTGLKGLSVGGMSAAREVRRGTATVMRAGPGSDGDGGGGGDERRDDNKNGGNKPRMNPKRIASPQFSAEAQTWALLGGIATTLTVIVALVVAANDDMAYFGGPDDFSYLGDDYAGVSSLNVSVGNVVACAVWSFGLFFKSPLQILLVFVGRTDTERPSDWMLRKLAPGSPTTFEDADVASKAATLAFFTLCGCGMVAVFDTLFSGEETWGLSFGLGFTMLSFVAELGSPQRYTRSELEVLEAKYADFVSFADESLQRRGRCHSTEVSRAFRRKFPKYYYRDGDGGGSDESLAALSDKDLHNMILNWHPNAERTSSGYYKNLSLQEGVDQRPAVTVKDLGL